MQNRKFGFVDDIFRHQWWPAKEFFYDLLRFPIWDATGERAPQSVRQRLWENEADKGLIASRALDPALTSGDGPWVGLFNNLTPEAESIYDRYIESGITYFAYELTPALRGYMEKRNIPYLDFRLSPLRFLPDLLIAVQTNIPHVAACLEKVAVDKPEIYEAAFRLRASYLHRQRHHTESTWRPSGRVVFVGQTAGDASLVVHGQAVTIERYRDDLAALIQGRGVAYLPHPAADRKHRARELACLQSLDPTCSCAEPNMYDLLCLDEDVELVGLSSGSLQEAAFFDKRAQAFLSPVCPVRFPQETGDGYYQMTLDMFTAPEWIRHILGQSQTTLHSVPLRNIRPNALRELHNAWWAYADHIVKDNVYWQTVQKPVVDMLVRNISFVLECSADKTDAASSFRQELVASKWKWTNGDLIGFDRNGDVYTNGWRSGQYAIQNGENKTIVIVWARGQWMNRLTLSPDGMKMYGPNNFGTETEFFRVASEQVTE
ncbi:MAG: hypothetical protein PHD48_10255 [Alphaproteobacteria bacterium]|nr:hypothetical protein [Alphaproteobacteria bacterium]